MEWIGLGCPVNLGGNAGSSRPFYRELRAFFVVQLQRLGVISRPSCATKCVASPGRLMPVAGLQDVGHAAVATGCGELRLRSFVVHFPLSSKN